MERATGIEPVLPTWEGKYSALYFQHLQNRSRKMHVHATHTVHAVPDLRIAAGRFAGRFFTQHLYQFEVVLGDRDRTFHSLKTYTTTTKSRRLRLAAHPQEHDQRV